MKILEAQSATLSNYEVYAHLAEQQARYKARQRMGPGNLNTLVKELMIDFRAPPSPLGNTPLPYNSASFKTLAERLRPYKLAKGEMLMILNHRPTHVSHLSYLVEDVGERFPEMETQDAIIQVIADVLGAPDGEAERTTMAKNAKEMKARQVEAEAAEISEMKAEERDGT